MKRTTLCSGTLLSFALSAGICCCLSTAFFIPVRLPVLLAACLGFSFLFSLCFSLRRSALALLAAALGLGLWLWLDWTHVKQGFLLSLECVMEQYALGFYSLAGMAPDFDLPDAADATALLAVLGALQAFFTAWTVIGRYSLTPLAAVSLPFLLLCLMIVDVFPAAWALVLVLGAYALLLLTQNARRGDGEEGDRLSFVLLVPTAALVILLALAVGPEEYERPRWPDILRERVDTLLEETRLKAEEREEEFRPLEDVSGTLGSFDWNDGLESADLSQVGRRWSSGRRAMEVYTQRGGLYYLRGNSLAVYEDNCWTALEEAFYQDGWNEGRYVVFDPETGVSHSAEGTPNLWLSSQPEGAEMRFRTMKGCEIYYIPYLPTALPGDAVTEGDAYIGNPGKAAEYTLPYAPGESTAPGSSAYIDFVAEHYLGVPEETRAALQPILDSLPVSGGKDDAALIRDYVISAATYSLDTQRVPEGEDFVSWFLTESETGYCVHFASSAAMLLRCAGIPSRYVSGYLVDAKAGEWTEVTQDEAHAWVEYFVPGLGWVILDPTPATERSESEAEPTAPPGPEDEPAPRETEAPQPEATPKPETVAGEGGNSGEGGGKARLLWILPVLAMALLIALWQLRRARIRRELTEGGRNARAIACYRRIQILAERSGETLPKPFYELGEKARFSQHTLSREELDSLIAWEEAMATALKDKRPLRYLLWRVWNGI